MSHEPTSESLKSPSLKKERSQEKRKNPTLKVPVPKQHLGSNPPEYLGSAKPPTYEASFPDDSVFLGGD